MNSNLKPSEKISSPFMYYCQKVIPLAIDESMSYYEQLCNLVYYLKNTVLPAVNNNADALTEVQKAFNQLEKYVNEYFENLDVQEEINNKLDEMAESGQLTDIIAQYLQLTGILAFNTKDDMKNAENLNNGSFVKTYGNIEYNDGKGHFYKIRNITSSDIVDDVNIIALTNYLTLIAELMPDNIVGNINNLNTSDKSSIVNAINEVNDTLNIEKIMSSGTINMIRESRDLISSSETHHNMQGATFINKNTVIRCLTKNDNTVKLQKINIKNGVIINQTTIVDGGHANWVDYNDELNEIYLTPLYLINDNSIVYDSTIYVIDGTSLEVKSTIDLNPLENVMSFIYDKITKKYYILCETSLYSYNRENNTYNEILDLNYLFTPISGRMDGYSNYDYQGAYILNNIIYLTSMNPYGLIVLKMNGDIIREYNYSYLVDDKYLIREIEGLTVFNDGDILFASQGEETSNGSYTMIQYFKSNIYTNLANLIPLFQAPISKNIYVNINSNSVNPVGSSSNPFKTIGEALDLIHSKSYSNGFISILPADGEYPLFSLYDKKITIESDSNLGNVIINGIRLFNADLTLRGIKLNSNANSDNSCIESYKSNIIIRRCDLNSANYLMKLHRSNLKFSTLTKNGNNPDMFTNKCVIYASYNSSIDCQQSISPLIEFDDSSNSLLSKCKFTSDFNYYYGEKSFPSEFINLIASESIKSIIFETSLNSSSNDNILNEFTAPSVDDSFRITNIVSGYSDLIISYLNVNYLKSQNKFNLEFSRQWSFNQTPTITKTELENDTPTNNYVGIKNIYLI